MTPRIFWAGDSTVTQNTFLSYPQSGIGQGMQLYVKKEIIIYNHAVNGRSTKSFIDESRLAPIYNEMREGDFFFIQFGHNDEKSADPKRYTNPSGEFADYLMRYINVAQNRNAHAVLITPLSRREFSQETNTLLRTHGAYPDVIRSLGKEKNIPVLDLEERSFSAISSAGDEKSKQWFMHIPAGIYEKYPEEKSDNTHLKYEGAVYFASFLAKDLLSLGGIYADLFTDEIKNKLMNGDLYGR